MMAQTKRVKITHSGYSGTIPDFSGTAISCYDIFNSYYCVPDSGSFLGTQERLSQKKQHVSVPDSGTIPGLLDPWEPAWIKGFLKFLVSTLLRRGVVIQERPLPREWFARQRP